MKKKVIVETDYKKKIKEEYPDLNILRETNKSLTKEAYEKMNILAKNFMNED